MASASASPSPRPDRPPRRAAALAALCAAGDDAKTPKDDDDPGVEMLETGFLRQGQGERAHTAYELRLDGHTWVVLRRWPTCGGGRGGWLADSCDGVALGPGAPVAASWREVKFAMRKWNKE